MANKSKRQLTLCARRLCRKGAWLKRLVMSSITIIDLKLFLQTTNLHYISVCTYMHITSSQRERRRKRDNRERNRANECLCKYQKTILYY